MRRPCADRAQHHEHIARRTCADPAQTKRRSCARGYHAHILRRARILRTISCAHRLQCAHSAHGIMRTPCGDHAHDRAHDRAHILRTTISCAHCAPCAYSAHDIMPTSRAVRAFCARYHAHILRTVSCAQYHAHSIVRRPCAHSAHDIMRNQAQIMRTLCA